MKKIILILTLLMSNLGHTDSTINVNFFQSASRASISTLHDKNYILSLTPPSFYVSYFQSKNTGNIGMVDLKDFLSLWNNKNNPYAIKASLAVINKKSDYSTSRIVVTNPSFANNTLSFQVAALSAPLTTGELKYLTLVFDSVSFTFDS